ncbi:MAG: lipid A export permease/ATP-binding protein MsbA [Gammaproteobacteria bacterium]
MNSKQLYLRLLKYVFPYRKAFLFSLLGTVIFAATEPAMPALMKPLLDETFVAKNPEGLLRLPLLLMLLFLVRGVASFISGYGMKWVATRVVMDLRREMFDKLQTLPVHYFNNHSSGNIISRYTFNVSRVMAAATEVVVTLVKDSLIIIGLLAYALYLNWQLSLIVFMIAPPTALIIRYFSRRMRSLSRSMQDSVGDLTRVVQEAISGNREVRIFGGESYEMERFQKINNWIRRYHMKVAAASEINVPVVQIFTVAALAIVVYFAAMQSQSGDISVGEFVALITALALLSSPIKRLTKVNVHLQGGLAAAESVFSLIDEHPEIDDGQKTIETARGNIEITDLGYTHYGSDTPVLRGINISISAGQTVALVGPSGGGKTTLASLLPRFYNPTTGKILLDGIDTRDIRLASLRKQIAYVGQNVILFNDTVANNIAYGSQLAGVSDSAIRSAAAKAHALEFIEKLPQGFDTLVGENGVLLSTGQCQRIAIARAIIKDAPILILDEATSALDTESEKAVQQALESLRSNRTSLVIAHRLSTIENADCILVIKDGTIVEKGTHNELINRPGAYKQLYEAQSRKQTRVV